MDLPVDHLIQAELLRRALGVADVVAGDHRDAVLLEIAFHIQALFGRPLQVDLHPGIHHLGAQRKGIDGGGHAVGGVGGHIADLVVVGHGARNGADQVFGLVDAAVVGAHAGMGHPQRTVQNLDVGMDYRRLEGRVDQLGCGGENHVAAVRNGPLDGRFAVGFRDHVVVTHRLHPVAQGLFQLAPAELVAVGPHGGHGVLLMYKTHLQARGAARQEPLGQAGQAGHILPVGGRLHGQLQRVRLGQHGDLVPHPVQGGAQFLGAHIQRLVVGIYLQKRQQRVTGGNGQTVAAMGVENLAEPEIQRRQRFFVLGGPALAGSLAGNGHKVRKAALLGEPQIVDLGQGIEIQELKIDPVFLGVGALGNHPGHGAGHPGRAEVFQHTDPLVALHHVEPVHELIGNDRIPDALIHLGLAQVGPFVGKFGVLPQQRHEVAGKGRGTAGGLGAHDKVHGDIHQPQRYGGTHFGVLQNRVQHLQVGILSLGYAGAEILLAHFQCFFIFFLRHRRGSSLRAHRVWRAGPQGPVSVLYS